MRPDSHFPTRHRVSGLLACLLIAFTGNLRAQEDTGVYSRRPAGTAKALEQYQSSLKAHKGNPEVMVLPGLVADRTTRTVEVMAESTGLPEGEPVEFLLVDQGSSHGYEALLWSFAKPSDVHRALEFIGLKPGPPRNLALLGLGSGGDRVKLSVRQQGGTAVPVERLVLDKETEKTLPEEGFVFSGSMVDALAAGAPGSRYVADAYDPRAVAPLYSEPAAVLDVPRHVEKGEAYGRQVANPEYALGRSELLTVILMPGEPNGRPRDRRLGFSVESVAGSTGVVFRLAGTNGVLSEAATITPPLERLVALGKDDGAAPGVALAFGDGVPLQAVGKVCGVLAVMESLGGISIDPPPAGQLYYRAFLPDKAWLKPEGRPTQPWELHLRSRDGKMTGEMVLHEPEEPDSGPTGRFKRKTLVVSSPESVRRALDADVLERADSGRPQLPCVLLVFADPALSYGPVARFLAPALRTHGTVYVFLEPAR